MKRFFIFILLWVAALNLFGADVVYNNVKYDIKHTGNLVFFGQRNPVIDINVINTYRTEARTCDIKCTVKSDSGELIYLLSQQLNVPAHDSILVSFSFYSPKPGFYQVLLEDGENYIKELNICYEPEKIRSVFTGEDTTASPWRRFMENSGVGSAQFKMTKVKEFQYREREVYSVLIKCPGMETLRGYYFVPARNKEKLLKRGQLLYGKKVDLEKESRYAGGCIDFILPIDSVATPDSLFYKKTFVKYLSVIEFLASKPNKDSSKIFVVGEGLMGGIALAAASVDRRIEAVAVYNPLLKASKVLPQVKCPVLFGIGLQDSIVSPRRIFDSYNRLKTDKEYYIFPFSGREEHPNWDLLKNNFLRKIQ